MIRRLPVRVQAILATKSELSIEMVIELTDKIIEISPTSLSTAVHTTNAPHVNDPDNTIGRIEYLAQQLAALARRVNQKRSRNRSRGRDNREDDKRNQSGMF